MRKSETVILRHPVVPSPMASLVDSSGLIASSCERGTAIFCPCLRIYTNMSCSQASSLAIRTTSVVSPFRSGKTAFAATHLARNGKMSLPLRSFRYKYQLIACHSGRASTIASRRGTDVPIEATGLHERADEAHRSYQVRIVEAGGPLPASSSGAASVRLASRATVATG